MTADEYRQKAEKLLTPKGASLMPPSERDVQQADVWARLAVSASISEQIEFNQQRASRPMCDHRIPLGEPCLVCRGRRSS